MTKLLYIHLVDDKMNVEACDLWYNDVRSLWVVITWLYKLVIGDKILKQAIGFNNNKISLSKQYDLYNILSQHNNNENIFDNYQNSDKVNISDVSDDCLSYIMKFLAIPDR